MAAAIACGCRAAETPESPPGVGSSVPERCPAKSTAGYFFPASAIIPDRDDSSLREWFGRILSAAKVLSISCGLSPETYRMAWLPSSRTAYVITATREKKNWRLTAAEVLDPIILDPRQDYAAGLAPPSSRILETSEETELVASLTELDFWFDSQYLDNPNASDGWTAFIEGRRGNSYRVLTRMNFEDAPFAAVARTFVRLARLKVPQGMTDEAGAAADPWAKLQPKTAWIHLGDLESGGDWAAVPYFTAIPLDTSKLPGVPAHGDVIELRWRTELYLLEFGRSLESRRMESPANKQLSEADAVGAVLPLGVHVQVEQVDISRSGGKLRSVWARISPR